MINNKSNDHIAIPVALSSDLQYIKLIDHFQHAEFVKCEEVLDVLEQRYPGHPVLLRFKDDLQLKLSLQNMAASDLKKKKYKRFKVSFKMGLFAVLSTLIILTVFFVSYSYLNKLSDARKLEEQATQLLLLQEQAEQLLIAGKPQDASDIVEKIRSLDPGYTNLSDLTSQTIDLLLLETKYQVALDLVGQNRIVEAVIYFREIDNARPGLWDVSQQIDMIASPERIIGFMGEGNAAFQVEMWDQVINAYENALILDPSLNDLLMNEQLSMSYLKKIPGMLQNASPLIEEIEEAYAYYHNAIALIPETAEFSSEWQSLQDICSALLSQKFAQLAKSNLEDRNQTESTIAEAIAYIVKAVEVNPNDSTLQLELKNAEIYQSAYKDIVELSWGSALSSLITVYSVDPDYANGNVRLFLYETYYALGKKYYLEGAYENSLENLKEAEFLSQSYSENLMKIFQVQMLLGDTVEKMGNFQEAVEYYQKALNGIQISQRLANHPTLGTNLNEATNFADQGDFGRAFVAYQDVLRGIEKLYSTTEIEIKDGGCLVFFADENFSTVDAILIANQLPNAIIITFKRNLIVPSFER